MKHKLYTFIGCSSVLEQYFQTQSTVTDPSLASALEGLKFIRESLTKTACADNENTSLEEALSKHIVTLLESIETFRSHEAYATIDDSLIDLLDYYFNIGDRIMGGGGETYFDNDGYDEGEFAEY